MSDTGHGMVAAKEGTAMRRAGVIMALSPLAACLEGKQMKRFSLVAVAGAVALLAPLGCPVTVISARWCGPDLHGPF